MADMKTEHLDSGASSQPASSHPSEGGLEITITHNNTPHTFDFPLDATITDLSDTVVATLSIPPANQKFLIPKLPLQKPPFKDPSLPLSTLRGPKITLLGTPQATIDALNKAIADSGSRAARRSGVLRSARTSASAKPSRSTDWKRLQDDVTYTFHTLRPLPHLPGPERSLKFLERLRDDPGIRASMRKHQWSVPLLTEMDPAEHTTHESRTLGLNRNKGEVIELRLRTDAYDGYRDYKTIRKTLCHELAHNVWGEHDRNFWNLCHEIEKEVERGDWTRGGHTVGGEGMEFAPEARDVMEEEHWDEGGWTGGEFRLGGGSASGSGETVVGSASGEVSAGGLSRREILAKAAEERMKKQRQVEGQKEGGASE